MNQISVLLPIKNAANTLAECIDSCLAQTLQDFELILIDDHSSDNSLALGRRLTQSLPRERLKLISNKGDGLVDALNTGLAAATAPLIARMDADDIMLPTRLAQQYAFMQVNPDVDVVGTQVALFPQAAIQPGYEYFVKWQNSLLSDEQMRQNIYVETPFTHPSVLFRRQRVIAAGGYRKGDFPEDYELWLRLNASGAHFAKLAQILLRWRESPQRLSRTAQNCRRQAFDQLRAHYLARDPRVQQASQIVIWGAGRATRKRAAHLIAEGKLRGQLKVFELAQWIDIDPNKIGNIVNGCRVSAPEYLRALEPKPLVLVYVNNRGSRQEIGTYLESIGYRNGENYFAVG